MTSRSSNEFNDQDIARVFEAHDVDVPADLDDLVLRAARQNGPAKNPSNNPINNQQAYRRNNWYMHGFAIAATVMLSIAIAPLLLQSPDTTPKTTLGDSDLALSTAATTATAATAESASPAALSAPSPEQETSTLAKGLAANSIDNVDALVRQKRAELTVVQESISGGSASADSELALDEASTDKIDIQNQTSLTSYDSDKPATWLDAIKTFAKNGEAELALKEYTKFRKRYPEHEPDFRLNNFIPKEFKPLKSLSPDALTSDTQQNNTTD